LPRIITYKAGTYQLADGNWQQGQLYNSSGDELRVRNPADKVVTIYHPAEVRAFVLQGDTFRVVRDVAVSARRRLSSAFAQQLFSRGSFALYSLENKNEGLGTMVVGTGMTTEALILQPSVGAGVRVPSSRGAFERAMLPLFGDCPELAEKIKAGQLSYKQMKQILVTYADWQRTSPQPGPRP
jgi:hypothetical protein